MTATSWTGDVSSDWSDSANWTNGVPVDSTWDVSIPATTNQPTLSTNVTVNSLSITGSDATLDLTGSLSATSGITLCGGNITGAGSIDAATPILGYGAVDASLNNHTSGITASEGPLTLGSTFTNVASLVIGADGKDGNAKLIVAGSGPSTATSVTFSDNPDHYVSTLEIAAGANFSMTDALAVATFAVVQLDANAQLADANGIMLANGTITGSGTLAEGTNVSGDGYVEVAVTGAANTFTASGGTLFIEGDVDQSGAATSFEIADGAGLEFTGVRVGTGGVAPIAPTVTFEGAYGALTEAGAPGTEHLGTITGFSSSDEILLAKFDPNDTIKVSDHTVTIWNAAGTQSETLTFADGTAMGNIKLDTAPPNTYSGYEAITICFMGGTMIRTPAGEVAVETLKRGDLVLTAEGAARPVEWLGRQTIAARFADPLRAWPVRVKAGALGENIPCRDLLLSPDHALLVGGILIHAGALVNNVSILRETEVPATFIYYHVELADHALILAENTPAETFVDNVDRLAFDNWAEHEALFPGGKAIAEMPYPRAKGRRQTPMHIKAALHRRASALDTSLACAVA